MLNGLKISLKQRLKSISKDIKEDLFTAYLIYKNPRTPLLPKILIVLLIGYFLSPIDLIPDFIPFFGYLDDLIIIPLGIILIKSLIPKEIWIESKNRAIANLPDFRYLKYFFAISFIILWTAIIYYVIKSLTT